MGGSQSSEPTFEEKTIDSAGNVNNNIVIQEAKDTHHQVQLNEKLLVATYILVFAEMMKLIIFVFSQWRNSMKKKYAKRGPSTERPATEQL